MNGLKSESVTSFFRPRALLELHLHPITLHFSGPNRHLEPEYDDHYFARYRRQSQFAVLWAVFTFVIFIFLDVVNFPLMIPVYWVLRFGIILPLGVIVLLISFTQFYRQLMQPLLAGLILIGGATITVQILITRSSIGHLHYAGIILVYLFGYTFSRIRIVWAAPAGLIVFLIHLISGILISDYPQHIQLNNNVYLFVANIVSMFACYNMELHARRDFYLAHLLKEERSKVTILNEELEERVKIRTSQLKQTNMELEREINERKSVQAALTISEERYRTLFAQADDLIILWDETGQIHDINPAAVKLLGFEYDSLIQQSIFQLIPQIKDSLSATAGKTGQLLEAEAVHHDGHFIPVELITGDIHIDSDQRYISTARDISERQRTNREMSMLAHAVHSISECISVTDEDNIILYVNRAFLDTYGYDESEVLGKHISLIQPAETPSELRSEILNKTIQDGWQGEIDNIRKDGSRFPVFLSTSPIRDTLGNSIALIGVARDISDTRAREAELHESRERLIQIADTIDDAVWIMDLRSRQILFISPAFDRIWEISRNMVQNAPENLLHRVLKADRRHYLNAVHNIRENRGYHEEYRLKLNDGSIRWVSDQAYPIRDKSGNSIRLAGIYKDITTQQEINDELRTFHDQLQELVNRRTAELEQSKQALQQERDLFVEGPVAVIKWIVQDNKRTTIHYVSPNVAHYGIDVQDIIERRINIWHLLHEDDANRIATETRNFIESDNKYLEQEFRIRTPNGQVYWLYYLLHYHPHPHDPRIRTYHSFFMDLTEMKQIQAELTEKQAQLAHSGRLASLGEMATGVAHELNQPLSIIHAQAEILKFVLRDLNIDDDEVTEDINIILEEVGRASSIIEQMRGFARKSVRLEAPVSLTEPLKKSLIFFREQFKIHNIQLNVNIPNDLPFTNMNPQRLEQIIVNFMSNARFAVETKEKLTDEPYEKRINLKCQISSNRTGCILEVTDNGIGMTPEEKKRCLEPFFTTKEVGLGTGLGLTIVHGIVKEFKGTMSIISKKNLGTTMRVTLPLDVEDDE